MPQNGFIASAMTVAWSALITWRRFLEARQEEPWRPVDASAFVATTCKPLEPTTTSP